MRYVYAASRAIVLSMSLLVAGNSVGTAGEWRPATSEEVRKYIADSTVLSQTQRGTDMAIYYKPDGTYHGKIDRFSWGVSFQGTWYVEANKACYKRGVGQRNVGLVTCRGYESDGKNVRSAEVSSNRGGKRVRGNKLP